MKRWKTRVLSLCLTSTVCLAATEANAQQQCLGPTNNSSEQLQRGIDCLDVCRQECEGEGCIEHAPCADAHALFSSAASSGDTAALFNLALTYANGWGVQESQPRATELYGEAAEQGLAEAQFNYGLRLSIGNGVPPNERAATRFVHAAAENGLARAQYELGVRFLHGRGVRVNRVQAYVWLNLASRSGYSMEGDQHLEWLSSHLSADDIRFADGIVNGIAGASSR